MRLYQAQPQNSDFHHMGKSTNTVLVSPATRYWTATAGRASHGRANAPNESLDLARILYTLARFHTTADIYGVRPNLGNGLLDVIYCQTSRKNQRLGQRRRNQRPIESFTRPARHASDKCIQENTAGIGVASNLGCNVLIAANS